MRTRPSSALAVAAFTAALAMGTSLPAQASCMLDERPMEDKIAEAQIVFVGTVDAVAHSATTANFEVEEVWKGADLAATVTVFGGSGQDGMMTSVDRSWTPGERYLVLPYPDGDRLTDNSCSATTVWTADFDALRPADAEVRGGPGEPTVVDVDPTSGDVDDNATLPIVLGLSAGLLAAAGVAVARRRRGTPA